MKGQISLEELFNKPCTDSQVEKIKVGHHLAFMFWHTSGCWKVANGIVTAISNELLTIVDILYGREKVVEKLKVKNIQWFDPVK